MDSESLSIYWQSHPRDIPAAAWELSGARQACLCLPFLVAMQDSAPGFVKSWHYATAHAPAASGSKGCVLGLLVAFVLEASDDAVLGPAPLRIFVLSDAMGMCRPPLLAPGRSAEERARVMQALLEAAISRAENERAEGVHAYWLGEGADELREAFAGRGFVSIPEDLCAHVPLTSELGAHPKALRSSYRSVLKRKRQQLTALGLSLRSSVASADAATLDALYQKVAERKEEERFEIVESRFPPRFFDLALKDPAFRLTLCEQRDGALCGYLLGIHSGDTFTSLAVGLDYERIEAVGASGLAAAVFLGLHAEALAQAQSEGARWAVLGITALEGKARVGALCERNFGMGLGLTERARAVLRLAQDRVPADRLPACRPYPEAALASIDEAAAQRGVRFTEPSSASDHSPDNTNS